MQSFFFFFFFFFFLFFFFFCFLLLFFHADNEDGSDCADATDDLSKSRKHAYIVLTPLNSTFIK